MKIIFGLGNPGEKYAHNRHNAGFIMLDELRQLWNFPEFESSKKFNSEMSEGVANNEKILLVRPQTFMNNSGEAVQKIISFYKSDPEDIIVIHDDLDIEIGNWKISNDSSAAGHNGVQDIFDRLGTQKITRLRLGVETEGGRPNRQIPGEDFVLKDFSQEECEKMANLAGEIKEKMADF